jgi:acyl-CoA dehydrogenase
VNPELPATVVEFADSAERALVAAGGSELHRRAETEPSVRVDAVEPVLTRLGIDDLEPRADVESALCAAELCRVSGRFGLPYPVEAVLGAPPGEPDARLALVDGGAHWVEHADMPGRWLGAGLDGSLRPLQPLAVERNRTLAPFVLPVALGERVGLLDEVGRALALDLASWRVLGALERALEMAVDHVKARRQFDRPLSDFQAVQFHVVDSEVAVRGLRQLARFTLWRLVASPGTALTDAWALRSFAIESARTVLGAAELLHGALAFCDEHDLTVLTRSLQAPLRLPVDLERTTELLAAAIDGGGFDGLFHRAGDPGGVGAGGAVPPARPGAVRS